jgi:uncharacterized protein
MDMQLLSLSLIGIAAGVLSGLFGIGGGIIIVPALVLLLGMPQHVATGTSLVALLLPVGILGVYNYYKNGNINSENIQFGLIIAAGLFIGAYFGSKIAIGLSRETLQKMFAGLLFVLSIYLFFFKK